MKNIKEKYSRILELADEGVSIPLETIDDGDLQPVMDYFRANGFDVEVSADTNYLVCNRQ